MVNGRDEVQIPADHLPTVNVEQFFVDVDRYVKPDPLRGPGEAERPV